MGEGLRISCVARPCGRAGGRVGVPPDGLAQLEEPFLPQNSQPSRAGALSLRQACGNILGAREKRVRGTGLSPANPTGLPGDAGRGELEGLQSPDLPVGCPVPTPLGAHDRPPLRSRASCSRLPPHQCSVVTQEGRWHCLPVCFWVLLAPGLQSLEEAISPRAKRRWAA